MKKTPAETASLSSGPTGAYSPHPASDDGHSHCHRHTCGEEHGHGNSHAPGHIHACGHPPEFGHGHENMPDGEQTHAHAPGRCGAHIARAGEKVLTVRSFSGLSGDMMLAGMALMAGATQEELNQMLVQSGVPQLAGSAVLHRHSLNDIAGWQCRVKFPHEHVHRTLTDVLAIIERSSFDPRAKELAASAFTLLAEAEGAVHGKPAQDVAFHEVGALDSILDICLVCALYARIAPALFQCSPLPLAEGGVLCAHGWLPTPAPATFELLQGVQVCGFAGSGETVTPTAIALLKTLGAQFGPWPSMTIEHRALVYGATIFPGVPNGALWALGGSTGS